MVTVNVYNTTLSPRMQMRALVAVIALWSALEGLIQLGFHGAASGPLGLGIDDMAGQRLLGAHLLVLAPLYGVMAWRFERYQSFAWVPMATQLTVAVVVFYSFVQGDTDFTDGFLNCIVTGVLGGALGVLSITELRRQVMIEHEESNKPAAAPVRPAPSPPSGASQPPRPRASGDESAGIDEV